LRGLRQTLNVNIVSKHVRNLDTSTMDHPETQVFKVWPTFHDQASFKLAMEAENFPALMERFPDDFTKAGTLRKDGDHPTALAAIWYFGQCFEDWIGTDGNQAPLRAAALLNAIMQDFKVIALSLEQGDDAQVIFETLNGRGVELHASDLIRNYVFMSADRDKGNAESLYKTLWAPFDAKYWSEPQTRGRIKRPRLEWLFHTFLQVELQEDVDLARLYHEYRRYAGGDKEKLSAEVQLLTITAYGKHYRDLVDGESTSPISRFGQRIKSYDITTVHALALMIATSDVTPDMMREMFGDLVSYIVRRFICGLTTKNYNNVFLNIMLQLKVAGVSATNLRKILSTLKVDNSRWPDDGEFLTNCTNAPLYYDRLDAPKMRGVLVELEAELRRGARTEEAGLPVIQEPDIDHIMPISWYDYWPLLDGTRVTEAETEQVTLMTRNNVELNLRQRMIQVRLARIPTLGNLTLLNLSVNREAQNKAFKDKRRLLIKNTSLRLNVPLVATDSWDEVAITKRAEELSQAALRIWRGPVASSPAVAGDT